jgi:plastocyanin
MIRTVAALLLVATIGGCSKPPGPPPSAAAAPSAPAAAATANAAQGQVAGKVHASGTAVVVLEPKTARTFAPQTDKPVMDQAGLTFGPDLLLVRTGQPVEFRNSDDTLHNVHVTHEETRTPAFNVAIPTGNSYNYTFDLDGFYRVGCDIHPAMSASVFAATTPYTVVAESDGRFTFSDVPTGAWTVTVYTGGKRLRKDIEVKGGLTEVTID